MSRSGKLGGQKGHAFLVRSGSRSAITPPHLWSCATCGRTPRLAFLTSEVETRASLWNRDYVLPLLHCPFLKHPREMNPGSPRVPMEGPESPFLTCPPVLLGLAGGVSCPCQGVAFCLLLPVPSLSAAPGQLTPSSPFPLDSRAAASSDADPHEGSLLRFGDKNGALLHVT